MKRLFTLITHAAGAFLLAPAFILPAGAQPAGAGELLRAGIPAIETVEEKVFPGLAAAPFDIMLLRGEQAFYLMDKAPIPADAEAAWEKLDQTIAGRPVFVGGNPWPPALLASFPVFSPSPVVVVGTPEATGTADAAWIALLMHEHFHQYQYTLPGYYQGLADLGLGAGDNTGQWMLNYPFPYQDEELNALFDAMGAALVAAHDAAGDMMFGGQGLFMEAVERYLTARDAFTEAAGAENAAYFNFQVWQEGFARYAEGRFAGFAGQTAIEAKLAAALARHGTSLAARSREQLTTPGTLADLERPAFYAVGHLEALLLDELRAWHGDYARAMFNTRTLLEAGFEGD